MSTFQRSDINNESKTYIFKFIIVLTLLILLCLLQEPLKVNLKDPMLHFEPIF